MIKVRIQGTPAEMEWLIHHLQKDSQMKVSEISKQLSNIGTKKYFRRFFHVTIAVD